MHQWVSKATLGGGWRVETASVNKRQGDGKEWLSGNSLEFTPDCVKQ